MATVLLAAALFGQQSATQPYAPEYNAALGAVAGIAEQAVDFARRQARELREHRREERLERARLLRQLRAQAEAMQRRSRVRARANAPGAGFFDPRALHGQGYYGPPAHSQGYYGARYYRVW